MTSLPPFLLSIRQAAKHSRLRRREIRRLIAIGQLPHYQVGRRLMIDIIVLDAVIGRVR